MKVRIGQIGAILSVAGLGAWLIWSHPGSSGGSEASFASQSSPVLQERTGGSGVPCATPLGWRVARVDDGFGLATGEARRAVEEAAGLWERAVDISLFPHDPAEGFPIRFVHDHRQARTRERVRRELELEEAGSRLDERREELEEEWGRHSRLRDRLEERFEDYQRRASAHNTAVRIWNQRGGAPEGVHGELQAVGDSLEAEARSLEAEERELEASRQRLQAEGDRLRRQLEEHRRRARDLEREFPPLGVESGEYREAVQTRNGRLVSVEREIRIYRFEEPGELRIVLAHEMGHALGLGHSSEPGAIMSEEHRREDDLAGLRALPPPDLELLRERCPELWEENAPPAR